MKAPCLATMLGAVLLVMTTFAYAEGSCRRKPSSKSRTAPKICNLQRSF